MLKTYLVSIVIWMIVMYCIIKLFGPKIVENKWTHDVTPTMGKFTSLFVMSAVPLLRCLFLFSHLYMASHKKEEFNKKYKIDDDVEEDIMHICLDCETTFFTPRQFTETHGLDSPPYETYWGCPKCGGAYVDARECDRCGQYILDDYIQFDDGTVICDKCYEAKNAREELWI